MVTTDCHRCAGEGVISEHPDAPGALDCVKCYSCDGTGRAFAREYRPIETGDTIKGYNFLTGTVVECLAGDSFNRVKVWWHVSKETTCEFRKTLTKVIQ